MGTTITLFDVYKKVLFTHTCEFNSVKNTVEEAIKQGVNLSMVKLHKQDLSNINLSGGDFSYADLRYTNLRNVNFSNCNLTGADLTGSFLSGTDFSGAKLKSINLINATLSCLSGVKYGFCSFSIDKINSLTLSVIQIDDSFKYFYNCLFDSFSGNEHTIRKCFEDSEKQDYLEHRFMAMEIVNKYMLNHNKI